MRLKGVVDPVTQVDLDSERMIVEAIRRAYPDHDILTEEGSDRATRASHRWIVDPVDGTTNFAHGYPVFGVSIALEREGVVVAGVVHAPALNETYWATLGGGAFGERLGRPAARLAVSPVDDLARAFVVTGFPYGIREEPETVLRPFGAVTLATFALRRDGSAAVDLCYVAAGVFDAFWEMELKAWDVAAGMLLVREAGGRVSDMAGAPYGLGDPTVAASNGRVHGALIGILAGAGAPPTGGRRWSRKG
jgi:myo-inositol-1(or 4)-monophosphatase